MESPRSKMLWERSCPLEHAWLELARDNEAKATFEKFDLNARMANASAAAQRENGFVDRALAFVSDLSEGHTKRRQIESDLKLSLQSRLETGEVTAFGYRETPSVSRTPVEIPKIATRGADIVWRFNQISSFGTVYGRVRIYGAASQGSPSAPSFRGRPGSGVVIKDAIRRLLESPEIRLCEMNRAAACHLIREQIGAEKISGNGTSDTNLAKYIREFCPKRNLAQI